MNDATLIATSESEMPLTAEQQSFLQAFLRLPPQELVQHLRVLQHWAQAPGSRKAIALLLLNAGLSSKDVAGLCGLSTRQLRRYPEYRAYARFRKEGHRPPRGEKESGGGIEAWEEDE
jgi:hypothetical protein